MSSSIFRQVAFSAPRSARAFCRMTIIGRLQAQPEAHATASGVELVKYAIATNHGTGEKRQTSWWNVTSFDTGAKRDFLLNLPQGTLVCLEASAKKNTWKDPESGANRNSIGITHRSLEVLHRPRPREQDGEHVPREEQQEAAVEGEQQEEQPPQ